MELIRGLHNLKPVHNGCVASIGNYDGLHRGHRSVLERLVERGKSMEMPVTVVTFDPTPQEYFMGSDAPPRLMTLRDKVEVFERLGVDRALILWFNDDLAMMRPEDFVNRCLIEGLGVRHLIVGDDFRFGYRRQGDFGLLQAMGREAGFEVQSMDGLLEAGERISSSRIRAALADGDIESSAKLFGHPFSITGRVAHGDRRGRFWGFPTANIKMCRRRLPLTGVYAVSVDIEGVGDAFPGVANAGVRPTVDGVHPLLEVHLLDFSSQIYGHHIRVTLVHKLRDEQRFESEQALREQIAADVVETRALFEKMATPS